MAALFRTLINWRSSAGVHVVCCGVGMILLALYMSWDSFLNDVLNMGVMCLGRRSATLCNVWRHCAMGLSGCVGSRSNDVWRITGYAAARGTAFVGAVR